MWGYSHRLTGSQPCSIPFLFPQPGEWVLSTSPAWAPCSPSLGLTGWGVPWLLWQQPALAGRSSREQDGAPHPYAWKDSSKVGGMNVTTLTGKFLEVVGPLCVSGKVLGAPKCLSFTHMRNSFKIMAWECSSDEKSSLDWLAWPVPGGLGEWI